MSRNSGSQNVFNEWHDREFQANQEAENYFNDYLAETSYNFAILPEPPSEQQHSPLDITPVRQDLIKVDLGGSPIFIPNMDEDWNFMDQFSPPKKPKVETEEESRRMLPSLPTLDLAEVLEFENESSTLGPMVNEITRGIPGLTQIAPTPSNAQLLKNVKYQGQQQLPEKSQKLPTNVTFSPPFTRSRRKSELGSRALEEDFQLGVDVKPDLKAQKRRKSTHSTESTTQFSMSFLPPINTIVKTEPGTSDPLPCSSSGSSRGSRKPKKYELDETQDPSVRNAKLARANREKKKQELEDAKQYGAEMAAQAAYWQEEAERLQSELNQEKSKQIHKPAPSFVTTTNAKQVIQTIVRSLQKENGPGMEFKPTQRMQNLPIGIGKNGELIGIGENSSSFLSFHVSAADQVTLIEYDPTPPV